VYLRKEATIDYHHVSAEKLRNTCRRSLMKRSIDLASHFEVTA